MSNINISIRLWLSEYNISAHMSSLDFSSDIQKYELKSLDNLI